MSGGDEIRPGRRTSDGTDFPPPPWQLEGTALLSLFTLPNRELSSLATPPVPGFPPVQIRGRVVVAVVAARYDAGSVLRYDELLLALPHRARRPTVSIPRIWVDNSSSMVGARQLWGIPKDLGHFAGDPDRWRTGQPAGLTVTLAGGAIASVTATRGRRLWPGPVTLSFLTEQRHEDASVTAHHLLAGTPHRVRASWTFGQDGPLAVLVHRKPFLSMAFDDLRLSFGVDQ